jgi:hypothetical protein
MAKYASKSQGKAESTYNGPTWTLDESTRLEFGANENPAIAEIRRQKGMSKAAKEAAIAALLKESKAWTVTLDRHDVESKAAPDRVWIAGPCKTVKISIRVLQAIAENAADLQKWIAEHSED